MKKLSKESNTAESSKTKTLPPSSFESLPDSIYLSKNDPEDLRLGDFILRSVGESKSSALSGISLQGYPDDEGIRLNGGRPGALEAPLKIREYLYKMTPCWQEKFEIQDSGNLKTQNLSLLERHAAAQSLAKITLLQKRKLVTLGGGHDYGYPDAAAFIESTLESTAENTPQLKPLVINIDAHLDVRPFKNQIAHSGTPFSRLLTDYSEKFDFIEIGLQPHCNSLHHKAWLASQGGVTIDIETIERKGLLSAFNETLKNTRINLTESRPVWLSVDIDGFHQSEAPGCSQSWPRGIVLKEYLELFQSLFKKCDLRGMGIYEVSPPLDVDHRTSKLAALLIYEFLRNIVSHKKIESHTKTSSQKHGGE